MKPIKKKGVTLIELIIVMVIIAIGATLVAPNIGRWIQHYQLQSATRDIVSTMRTAQMRAVSTNMEHRVSFNNPVTGSYVLQRNNAGQWVNEGASQTLPTGITMSNNFTGSAAQFNPNTTSSSGSVTLTNIKNSTRRIVLASTGRIRVE